MRAKYFIPVAVAVLGLGLGYGTKAILSRSVVASEVAPVNTAATVTLPSSVRVSQSSHSGGKTVSTSDASFIDYSHNLSELSQRASLVVIAKVTDQKQFSPYAVKSSLQVIRTIKGTSSATPDLYQMGSLGSADLLQVGQIYFLFLDKQGLPNGYDIVGGEQGQFLNKNGKLDGWGPFVAELNLQPGQDAYKALEAKVRQ